MVETSELRFRSTTGPGSTQNKLLAEASNVFNSLADDSLVAAGAFAILHLLPLSLRGYEKDLP